jgi:hypothetical protein
VSAFPAFCFSASIASVLALLMNTFTAIFLDLLSNGKFHGNLLRLVGLVLDDDDDAGVVCRRRQRSASAR